MSNVITITPVGYSPIVIPLNVPVRGSDGWTLLTRLVSDNGRIVREVYDAVGGEGAKPDAVGMYEGVGGYVPDITDALDVQGPQALINALPEASSDITDDDRVPTAESDAENVQRSAVEVFDLGATLDRGSVSHAQASTVRKAIRTIRVGYNFYQRASAAPNVPGAFRSQDRWTSAGNNDSVNGGWWKPVDISPDDLEQIRSNLLAMPAIWRTDRGRTFDAQPLIDAIARANNNSGDNLPLPAGTIVIEEPLIFAPDIFDTNRSKIEGSGLATNVQAHPSSPEGRALFEIEGGHVVIEKIAFTNPDLVEGVYAIALKSESATIDTLTRDTTLSSLRFTNFYEAIRNENQGRVTLDNLSFLANGTAINFENGGHMLNASNILIQGGVGMRFHQTGPAGVGGWTSEGRGITNIQMVLMDTGILFTEDVNVTAFKASNISIDALTGACVDIRASDTAVKNDLTFSNVWLGSNGTAAGGSDFTTGFKARGVVRSLKILGGNINNHKNIGVDINGANPVVDQGLEDFLMCGVSLTANAKDMKIEHARGDLIGNLFSGTLGIDETSDTNFLTVRGGSMVSSRIVRRSTLSSYKDVRDVVSTELMPNFPTDPVVQAAQLVITPNIGTSDVHFLDDDTAYSFVPQQACGKLFVRVANESSAEFFFSGSTVTLAGAGAALFVAGTGVLTGTTGTDNLVTVSFSGGRLYIENRRGATRDIGLLVTY